MRAELESKMERTGMIMIRLRWHEHVERKDDEDYVKACTVGRPRKTWQNILFADMRLL